MFSRFLAPTLIAFGMLACATDLPLEAQRTNSSHARMSGPLVVDSVTGQLLDRTGTFTGSFTITSISRNAAGDSLFAGGSYTGTVTQGETVTQVSGSFTNMFVEIDPQSTSCNHVYFFFSGISLAEVGTSVPFPRGKTTISDSQLSRAICSLAWEAGQTSPNIQKEDRYLATINGIIGG